MNITHRCLRTSCQLRDSSLEDRQGLLVKDRGAWAHRLRGWRRRQAGSRAAAAAAAGAAPRRRGRHTLGRPSGCSPRLPSLVAAE